MLPDTVRWNPDNENGAKQIELGDKARDVVVESLKQADQRKQLAELHIPLWERFIGD